MGKTGMGNSYGTFGILLTIYPLSQHNQTLTKKWQTIQAIQNEVYSLAKKRLAGFMRNDFPH
jgi:hypothetical protein